MQRAPKPIRRPKGSKIDCYVAISYRCGVKKVVYTKSAARVLIKLPLDTAMRIRNKVDAYAADPASQANNVKALKGSSHVRLRVGDWRLIMEDRIVLEVVKIGPRGDVYD